MTTRVPTYSCVNDHSWPVADPDTIERHEVCPECGGLPMTVRPPFSHLLAQTIKRVIPNDVEAEMLMPRYK